MSVKQCEKCGASETSVYFASAHYCQDCETDIVWKRGDKEHSRQMGVRKRMMMRKKAKQKIDAFVDEQVSRGIVTRENLEEV